MSVSVDEILREFKGQPDELIPALQAAQNRLGWLSGATIRRLADHFRLPQSTVFGVASFYEQFYLTRQGKHKIKVCQGTSCHIRGGTRILRAIEKKLGIRSGETTPDYQFTLERVACFGACALSPVIVIDGTIYGGMTPTKALALIENLT
ncbi:MAG: NAD(P)H-dependent oxidoreductase subunit E [bacterium]